MQKLMSFKIVDERVQTMSYAAVFSTKRSQVADDFCLAVSCACSDAETACLEGNKLLEKSIIRGKGLCYFMPEGSSQRLSSRPTTNGSPIEIASAVFQFPDSYLNFARVNFFDIQIPFELTCGLK